MTPAPRRLRRHAAVPGAAVLLAGCSGIQSALDPAGPNAREIEALWWWMAVVAVAVFALVLGSLLFALFGRGEARARLDPTRLIIGGGIALPVVVLSVLVPFNVNVSSGVSEPRQPETLTIRVHGHQWWWDVEYDFGESGATFQTANEIWLPLDEPVELILTSGDVIHSLWFPTLAGKLDLIPGRENRMMIEADTAGTFRGQCAEYCGLGHAKMALYAVAATPERFAAWVERQRRPAREPESAVLREGADLFRSSGCPLCHTVRGHGAWGREAPDLTHVGSRLTIGAGILDNTPENLALWIAHNDALKRGNRMPDYGDLGADTRRAISAYLESLE